MTQPPALWPGCFLFHSFLCCTPALAICVCPVAATACASHHDRVSRALLHPGHSDKGIVLHSSTDHVTLTRPTAHLPCPSTWTCLVPSLPAGSPVPALSLTRDQTEPTTCFFSVQTSHFKLSHVFPTWLCHEDYDLWQREAAEVLHVLAPSGTAGSRCLELKLPRQPKPIGYEFLGHFGSLRASTQTPGEQG